MFSTNAIFFPTVFNPLMMEPAVVEPKDAEDGGLDREILTT
jgi:hypothetical protein